MRLVHDFDAVVPAAAKWAFSTRRVDRSDAHGLSRDLAGAVAGDLLLARVAKLGQHRNIQLAEGRMSTAYAGDLVVLCVGDRYAPDQFEGRAEIGAESCDLIAGGGIAGRVVHAHAKMSAPTRLEPIGLLVGATGEVLNVAAYRLAPRAVPEHVTIIGVFGTSMNSGKTTTASSLAHGLLKAGRRVAAIKATGTGAFGDFNAFRDAGVCVTDFTDAGMPTTYRMPLARIEEGFATLVGHAAAEGAEIVVVEFADGVFQGETRRLLEAGPVRERLDAIVFAAGDAAGAIGAVGALRAMGCEPLFLSGLLSCSPLAMQEAVAVTGQTVLTRTQLHDPATVEAYVGPVMRPAAPFGVAA